ncbi:winged helix-turn-helix transcriptional regulator [Limnoglobus roseus]|nr:winged helix-turn-helix transcriptional regulator [Limnoglobus roseus]
MARLRLPGSAWQVLFLLATTSCRYGGRDVRLSLQEIATKTGLPSRTVKAAVADLLARGLISRPTRCRRIAVSLVPRPAACVVPAED